MKNKIPTSLNLHKRSKKVSILYPNDETYCLQAEYLRVLSPSAEVRNHGKPVLQTGKLNVGITKIELVGHYAIKLVFDDGHASGLYTWSYLYDLCIHREAHWEGYMKTLYKEGASRCPDTDVITFIG